MHTAKRHTQFFRFGRTCLRLVLLVLGLLAAQLTWGQSNDKWLNKGLQAQKDHEYAQAITYLQWSVQHGGGWQSKLAMADCYRALMNYRDARTWYAQVIDEPGIPPRTYFYYGQALMTARQYAEAEQWFARYAEVTADDPRAAVFRNLDKLVAAVMGDSMEFAIERMPINSSKSDFSTCPYNGGLLFASGRPNEIGVKHISTVNDAQMLDIYWTKSDSNGRWSRPKPLGEFNTKFNEGPMAIDTARQLLYITRNDVEHRKHRDRSERRSLNRLRIDQLRLTDGKWIEDGGMPFNDPRYAVGHPTLSPDGGTMYFASDMPGGMGGTDLYRSQWSNGAWTTPVNLGPTINTAEDEMFPHLDDQGLLYFSSNGHLGLGGLDIFYVLPLANGAWGRVQNLGYPINSEADDFGIMTDRGGAHGYFSSNRGNSLEDDDVYAFLRDWPRFECAPMLENNYCFSYVDEGFLDIDTLPFAYEWVFGDGTKQRAEEGYHCYDGPGEYHIEFNIVDTLLNTVFLNQNDYVLVVKDTAQVTINVPDTVAVGQLLQLNADNSVLEGCAIERYYWEMGDGNRAKGLAVPHAYDAPGTYEIRLGVTGMPNDDGELVCKKCVTKEVVVVEPKQMEAIRQAREQLKARRAELSMEVPKPTLRDTDATPIELRDTVNDTKYTLELQHSVTPIDRKKAPFNGLKDLTEVRTADGFTLYQGQSDNPIELYPQFVHAKQLGFEDAVVVILPDSMHLQGLKPKSTKIPFERTNQGITLFLGEIQDAQGHPLKATITIEDLEKSEILYRETADSSGQVQIKLPNGKVYAWTAEVDDYFPVSGMLDLTLSGYHGTGTALPKEHIRLQRLEDLAASGESVVIQNIFFDFDSDRLRPESIVQIQRVARFLIEYPEIGVEVSAHTDDVGNDAYNQDLSRRRAYAVLRYMIASGYDIQHITSAGYGESRPAVPNDTDEHRQMNRRVEFKFHPITKVN